VPVKVNLQNRGKIAGDVLETFLTFRIHPEFDRQTRFLAKRSVPQPFPFFLRNGESEEAKSYRVGIAEAFNRAILPFGPTAKGSESAFQFPSSRSCQVVPLSRLISEPFVPTVIQILSASDHWTAER
jgi:hypothetical protein